MHQLLTFLEKKFTALQLGLFLFAAVVILSRPIQIFKDSAGYIEASIIRLPLYPLFLKANRALFGELYQWSTVVLQMLFIFGAIYIFIRTLRKYVCLPSYLWLIFTAILLAPCLYDKNIANSILSESLSYALYLGTIRYFIIGVCEKERKALLKSSGLIFLLLLTRGQFLFLWPVSILIGSWFLFAASFHWKNISVLVLFLIVPVLAGITEKTYHLYEHDAYVSTPWSGIHLLTPALYVAEIDNVNVYTSEAEKAFFKSMMDRLRIKGLHSIDESGNQQIDIDFYIKNFTEIANATLYSEGKDLLDPDFSKEERLIRLDQLTRSMTLPLILNNPQPWLELYLKNFIHAFGSTKDMLLWLIVLVLLSYRMLDRTSAVTKIIVLSLLLMFANAATLSVGIMTIKRYLFYNDWVLFLIVFILLQTFIARTSKITS